MIRVVFDPKIVSLEKIIKFFFEIHDPTQTNGQGPDIGEQYLSVLFYDDENQKEMAKKVIDLLEQNGEKVATKVLPVTTFWPAEDYHQGYYGKTGKMPYCHTYEKKFVD